MFYVQNIVQSYQVQDGESLTINFRRFPEFCFPHGGESSVRFSNNSKIFDKDGVHLTTAGYKKVEKRYRGLLIAILNGLKPFFGSI